MRSEGYGTWSVCVSVHGYSGTTGYGVAYEQYQRLQNNESLKTKKAIFLIQLRSGDMAWE